MKTPKLILIVEDEFDIASTLELALNMEHHEVKLSFQGKEALEILAMGPLPDLIISDVMMPLMNGYEFVKAVRAIKRYEDIPLILMSAAKLDEKKLVKGSYSDFIRKPFDLDDVIDKIEKLLK